MDDIDDRSWTANDLRLHCIQEENRMKHIVLSLRPYPTDCTFILKDSQHEKEKEYLIEGDGWQAIQAVFISPKEGRFGSVKGGLYPEGHLLYEPLHAIFLSDYQDLGEELNGK